MNFVLQNYQNLCFLFIVLSFENQYFFNQIELPMDTSQLPEEEVTRICKICQTEFDENGKQLSFIHPCKCKGTIKYMHEECLKEWISLSNKKKCEICGHEFQFKKSFKPNTPKNIPLTYVILFFLKKIFDVLLNMLCSMLSISKILGIFLFNFYICKFYFSPKDTIHILVLKTISMMLMGLVQSIFIKKTIKTLSLIRVRIPSNEVLENLLSEISSRPDSVSSQYTAAPEADSNSNDLEDQAVLNNFGTDEFIISGDILFRRPTLNNLKQDLILAMSLSHLTIISFLMIHFCEFVSLIFHPLGSFIYWNTIPIFFNFYEKIGLNSFYLCAFSTFIIISIVLTVFNIIKSRTSSSAIKTIFYLLKIYSVIVLSSIFSSITIGSLVHFIYSYKLNAFEPIFAFKDASIISFCTHLIIGGFFTFLIRETVCRLSKKFRPGLLLSPPKDSSYISLIEISTNLSLYGFICKSLFNFSFLCVTPGLTLLISIPKLKLSFNYVPTVVSFIHFKTFLLIMSNATNISRFFAIIFSYVVRQYSKLFDADNYIYNTKVPIKDKKRLIWALNVPFTNPEYLRMINKINLTLDEAKKKVQDRDNDKGSSKCESDASSQNESDWEVSVKNESQDRTQAIRNKIETNSEGNDNSQIEEGKYNDVCNSFEETTNNHDDQSFLTKRRSFNSSISNYFNSFRNSETFNSQSSYNSPFENSTMTDRSPKATQTLIKNIQNNEKMKIFDRYEINKRRIAKYYGIKHNRKISIFYKPARFTLLKLLSFITNFSLIQIFLYSVFKVSYYICEKINFKTDEYKSVFVIYMSALIVSSIAKFVKILNKDKLLKFKAFLNPLILIIYTNFVFPFIASLTNVLLFANHQFTAFSQTFIILFSFSAIACTFFCALFIVSSIDNYSPLFIIKQIILFLGLKVIFLSMYLTYNRIIILTSMYPLIIFTFILGYYIYKTIRVVFVGTLMENIRDYFFLDKTEIINYESGENE